MLDVRVWAVYGNKKVVVRLKYVEELNYPLMGYAVNPNAKNPWY